MTIIIKKIFILACFFLAMNGYANEKQILTSNEHQQLIMVITDNWQTDHGLLYTFEKSDSAWQQKNAVLVNNAVTVGKNGLAWGLGLHSKQQGQYKKEGDGKAPAGIFTLGEAFGYLKSVNTGLPYQQMSTNDYCIDVNGSPYYNQLVDQGKVGKAAIKGSSEPMRRDIHVNGDIRYRKGVIVQHNPQNISGQGSCIFMHIWKSTGIPTSGCTAMEESTITSLLAWLDVKKHPLYVVLTKAEYQTKQNQWGLPKLN